MKLLQELKELNRISSDQDFRNIPVYEVLEKHGIVRKENDHFLLNVGKTYIRSKESNL